MLIKVYFDKLKEKKNKRKIIKSSVYVYVVYYYVNIFMFNDKI